jgi:hypothetical protein
MDEQAVSQMLNQRRAVNLKKYTEHCLRTELCEELPEYSCMTYICLENLLDLLYVMYLEVDIVNCHICQ